MSAPDGARLSTSLDLATALDETSLRHARVVAGASSLARPLRWVHMVDHPDITAWVEEGQLLLTTGYHWPDEPAAERALIETLVDKGLAGVALAVPRFLSAFPQTSLAVAEALDFPLLEIPWNVPFSQITEDVHAWLIARQGQLIARAEQIHRDLTRSALTAEGLGDIAGALGRLLERDVLFTGPDGEWLGSSGGLAADAGPTSSMLAAARRTSWRVTQSLEDQARRLLFCPVQVRETLVAILWIDEASSLVGELERRAAEQAALISALHLSHQQALQTQEARLGYAFVDSLLEGRFEATPAALERAALQGWDAQTAYHVCGIRLDDAVPLSLEGLARRERWERRLRDQLDRLRAPALISVSLNRLTFLVRHEVSVAELWQCLNDGQAALAVSREVVGAAATAEGARDVARLLPSLGPGERRDFEAILFTRVLEGDAEARTLFLERISRALQAGGPRLAGLDTLMALSDSGFLQAQAARALGIHISTLRYRIERLEDTLKMDLGDPEVRLQLQVATRLLRRDEH